MYNDFNILLDKLKGFKRKYYKNLILKGLIISFSIILIMFLVAIAFEYLAWNNTIVRTLIFYLFNIATVIVLFYYIIIPLLRLAKIGKSITNDQAAQIIGQHFPDVNDKLLNTLQLYQLSNAGDETIRADLLIASIDQKAAKLSPIPFKRAIDLKKNTRYLKYIIPPVAVIIISLFVFPAFITEPSARIIKYNEAYAKPLPYSLRLINDHLEVLQKDNFTVKLLVEGEVIPANIRIDDGNYMYRMVKEGNGIFNYTFKDVSSDIYFKIVTEDFLSESYHLHVIPKPIIYSFNIILDYPNYLKRKNDLIENSGDLVVPEGTNIEWQIFTKDASNIIFKGDGYQIDLPENETNIFSYEVKANHNFWYSLFAENQFVKNQDSLSYTVQVVKDDYPGIDVNQVQDEAKYGFVYFTGALDDDHGFHSFKFYYQEEGSFDEEWKSINLNLDKDLPKQFFSYTLQSEKIDVDPGTGINYYFEVRDNDAVNGYKRTKTAIQKYRLEGKEEIEEKLDSTSEKIKEKIKKTLEELEDINKKLEEKQLELFDKKDLSWQDKKQLSELLDQQKNVENQLKDLKKLNEELKSFEDLLEQESSEQLKEKMNQLDQMIEQLMAEDAEKLKDEIEKLDKDKLNQMLKKLESENQSLKTDLEQKLELYKQLEFEKKVQETINELNKLADEQKQLAEETKDKERSNEDAKEKQDEINDQFKDIEKELQESEQLNSELEDPFNFDPNQQEIEDINQELNNASDKLEKGKQKQASESQESAGEKMKKMADGLSMMMQSAMESRMGEDAEKIKNILDNLLDLSFSQESLMDVVKMTNQNDPLYINNLSELQIIKDGYLSLHDSLISISKRQMTVQQFIVKESDKINLYINRALLYLQDRKVGQALNDQQYSMTSMNNLALMLSESLDQMQAGMKASGENAGKSCPNPGEGKPGNLEDIIQKQQGLNKGMTEGKKNKGLEGEQGLNQQSEQLARMAARQSEIRKQLREYLDKLENQQGGNGDLSKLVDEMKKAEDDIVNRKITKETLERQKQIEVRLLKSEKAKLEREKKETRKSEEGINRKKESSGTETDPKNEKKNKEDFLQPIPIEMTPYFNDLLKRYLYKIETKNGS